MPSPLTSISSSVINGVNGTGPPANPELGLQQAPVATLPPCEDSDAEQPLHTVDQLVRSRARTHPHHVIVSYPSSETDYVDYSMQQLDFFAYRVAKHYLVYLPQRLLSEEKPAVVAVLGPSNLNYLVTLLALSKLGHTALLLSTRITQEAVESLLSTTGASFLLYHPNYRETVESSQRALPQVGALKIVSGSKYNFPVEVYADTRLCQALDPVTETNHNVFIIHSSGSTGLPKPIYQTHRSALANYAIHMGMKAFITLPLYHNHGICNMFRAIHSAKPIALYNADLPLTQEHLASILSQGEFEIFYGVPYALKVLSETAEGISLLRRLKIVMFGGSACPDDLGGRLVDEGVNLVGHYGATEVGQLMTSFRPEGDKAWNYVRESDALSPYLKWVPRGSNLFECTVLPGWPAKVATNRPDGSYATKDLFEPHPTIPRAWKYVARLDDTIVLVNGEKFNPIRLEGIVRSHKSVTEAVVFGTSRAYLGICIIPSLSLAGTPLDAIFDIIWPVIDSANSSVESYARVSQDMVILLPPGSSYPQTDKGSVIRQAFYKAFAALIDEAYDAADRGGGDAKEMTEPELRQFLRETLTRFLPQLAGLDDDVDVFTLGLDSLQAIHTRSEIVKAVDVGDNKLGQTVVFDHPSISKLSSYLHRLRLGLTDVPTSSIEAQMQCLIDRYAEELSTGSREARTFVVTGATGSLGAHIVSLLIRNPEVDRVYCLVRAKSTTEAPRRVWESLILRRLYHTLSLAERCKISALPCELSHSKLGLDQTTYQEVAASVSAVVHCAWSVNFNMHLSSFENDIAGVSNLLHLCTVAANTSPTSPPPSFNFCSSVSAVARSPMSPVPETVPELGWAQQMGYAQSKSVAENICERVGRTTGVPVRILRVGQIVGDTQNGMWSPSEAIPMILQTAKTIGALPRLQETPSWLPVDVVAQSIIDISTSGAGSVFCNVTNPRTFSWADYLLPALREAGLKFEEVEPQEWVQRLRESDPDPARNPPIKLVEFFVSKYDRTEFSPSKAYATATACSLSPTLASAPILDGDLVRKFIRYFQNSAWNTSPEKSIIVVAGPCGSGKFTLGASLAQALAVPFVEGYSLHSRDAVEKMTRGVPLADDDRTPWLERLAARSLEGIHDMGFPHVVLSCSALRRSYRNLLRSRVVSDGVQLCFLDLQCEREVLVERVRERKGHYMSVDMVNSQILAYEPPAWDETDVFPLAGDRTKAEVFTEATWLLERVCRVRTVFPVKD